MEEVGNLLQRRLKSFGIDKAAKAARVCEIANQVGEGDFEPISFRNGALKIRVDSDSRAHLIMLSKDEILKKINHRLGGIMVEKIKFIIK